MRRTLRLILSCALPVAMTACVYTTETREAAVSPEYSVLGVRSFRVVVDCKNVRAVHVYNGFAEDFCPVLDDTVRIVLKERHPRLSYRDTDADLTIDISLEDIHGGNAGLRKSGLGAGNTLIGVFIRISKGDQVVAQTRFDMNAKTDDPFFGDRSNESVLLNGARGVAKFVSDFVNSPKEQTIHE